MKLFRDTESQLSVHTMAKVIVVVALFYAVVYELAAAVGRQAGVW
jgi:hypothetical protein